MTTNEEIGLRLRDLRVDLNITQLQMTERYYATINTDSIADAMGRLG
jgi:hypothetical protein